MDVELSQPNPKISELSQKAKVAELNSVNLMEPGQKPRRGRPPGSAKKAQSSSDQAQPASDQKSREDIKPQAQGQISSSEIARPMVMMISKAAGSYCGDKRAEMTAQESDDMSKCFGLVLDKWMPTVAKDFGPELLLFMTVSTYSARVVALKKVLEEDRKRAQHFEKKLDPEKPMASQLAISSELKPMVGSEIYISPSIGL